MDERFTRLGHNKDNKITVELEHIEAMILASIIAQNIEELRKQISLDSMCKLLFLQKVGKKIMDQIVPEEQQAEMLADILLKAMKEEEEQQP